MTQFEQTLIEDPQFLKWVFHPNSKIKTYWEVYFLEYPDKKEKILELKKQFSVLKFENETFLPYEKDEISKHILNRINQDRKHTRYGTLLTSFLKYAAVAVVFTVIGGILVYQNMSKKSVYQQYGEQTVQIPPKYQGPLLITANGDYVDLKKSNSIVDYSSRGSVVLNNDTVIHTSDQASAMNQLVIPYGNQSHVVLPDNTIVWLNAGSRLVYPTQFNSKNREVMLFGEAFFDVSKNPEQPFIVKTSDLQIKVLGTRFNVSAYAEDPFIQTVLEEGRVAIRPNHAAFFERDLELAPRHMASYSKTSEKTNVYSVNVDYYTLWTKGLLSFNESDYSQVLKKVERFYNISFHFSDPSLRTIRISGKLDLKQKMNEVFEYLEKVSATKIYKTGANQFIVKK